MRKGSVPRAVAASLALTLAAGLLAACGGGDDGETVSTAGFSAAADRVCAEAAAADIDARRAGLATAAYLERLRDDREATLTDLEALAAPDDVAAAYAEYLESRRRALVGIDEGIAAARADEAGAVEEFRAAARRRVEEGLELAGETGLTACAGLLSPSERGAAEESIALSVQPEQAREFCGERTSAAMVEANFGSVAECVRQQSQRPQSSAVSVELLRGVDGVGANAVAALGRPGGGAEEHYEVALVYEDGIWKFDAVSEAPPEAGS